jgi:hypothetical protein
MQADDFAWEVNQRIASAVPCGSIHAMHSGHAPWLCQTVKLANSVSVVVKKLIAGNAIAHVTLI